MKLFFYSLICSLVFISCISDENKKRGEKESKEKLIPLQYSTTFQLIEGEDYKKIIITKPWAGATEKLTYYLAEDINAIPDEKEYDAFVQLPVNKIVVTSTTHIPSLISLNQLDKLVGFSGLDYISSPQARALIEGEKIAELGQNEALNTEKLLEIQPDVVIGFGVEGSNKSLKNIEKANIPVLYNSDWLDEHPLGKAEWIKFFGILTNTYEKAETEFKKIEENYLNYKNLATKAKHSPSLLSGAMYKDVWYLPGGKSWQAQFLKDANGYYLYADTDESGSLSKSFEAVLSKAKDAEYWISPAQFSSYSQMLESSKHYGEFSAFQNKKIYTIAKTKGETGGVLYYELAPNRPDLVLRDLVGILHPDLLEINDFTFFKPLDN